MNFQYDRSDDRRRKSASPPSEGGGEPASKGKKSPPSGEVGNALRTVYQQTVNEDIPPEMLDLLGKLG